MVDSTSSDSSMTYQATANIWPLSVTLGSRENSSATKIRADGQPMKKRGPKPRNKPNLTRKQELARKAQRNHRERKEFYVKALEQEVLQLKEEVVILSSSNDRLAEEARQLKSLLGQRGKSRSCGGETSESSGNLYGPDGLTSGIPYSHGTRVDDPVDVQLDPTNKNALPSSTQASTRCHFEQETHQGIDYDQAGIDFVLELERPCLGHMRVEPEDELYGHALMASCTPGQYPEPNAEMTIGHGRDNFISQQTCSLSKPGLANLLERSRTLDLGGEVTPVMAWDMILNHPRLMELRLEDFEKICRILKVKVKCYGFGAVFEEFEVRDAIENIMSAKSEAGFILGAASVGEICNTIT